MVSRWISWSCIILLCDSTFPMNQSNNYRRDKRVTLSAYVGNIFLYQISDNFFDKKIVRYKAFSEDDDLEFPEWLSFNETNGLFEGVPKDENLGEYYFNVKGYDNKSNLIFKQDFCFDVSSGVQVYGPENVDFCDIQEDKTVLIIIASADFSQISSQECVQLLKKCAFLLNISPLLLRISEQDFDFYILSDTVLDTGPGNAKRSVQSAKSTTVIHWLVGCNGNLWASSIDKLETMKNMAKNGSLSSVLGYPIIGWRLLKDDSKRLRREVVHTDDVTNTLDEEYSVPERAVITDSATPIFGPELSPTIPAPSPVVTLRHHRHNHGDSSPQHSHRIHRSILPSELIADPSPSQFNMASSIAADSDIVYNREIDPSISVISPSPSLAVTSQVTDITEADSDDWAPVDEGVTEGSTPPIPNQILEEFSNEMKNSAPEILSRVQKIPVTAGKLLRHQLADSTFFDREDGYSRNLTIAFLTSKGQPIPKNSWIHFNEKNLEIYGIPLEEHVSRWTFILRATDSGGLSVEDNIEILVRHHKGGRTVNHAIIIEILAVPPGEAIDWQISLLDKILEIFPDSGENYITVLSVNSSSLPYSFTFTNDSFPRNPCPREEMESLVKVISSRLPAEMGDTLKIGLVKWEGKGHCESKTLELPFPSNTPPISRNQIDNLDATEGQLMLFTVPADTFYDKEDKTCKNLHLSMEGFDFKPVPSTNWLQFDDKNQEFFGIPMATNVGPSVYVLICEDSGGLTVHDSLLVTVHPAPKTLYNVEFSMTLLLDYQTFVDRPDMQRDFIQRLANLFGDPDTKSIVLSGLSPGSTVITWHNKSLPSSVCPDQEILHLRQVMLTDDEKITPAVTRIFGVDFSVQSAKLTPTGLCQGAFAKTHVKTTSNNISTDVTVISHGEHYIIGLVVPAVVIAVMLLCAGFVACVLYRRKRTGKMSVGDEDERQSFRSKGIPVIFQDELDERPEPSNKSPVIMKEEKPPLAPPEYQRGTPLATTALLSDTEDTPYQPPPPFTTSRDSARPKPTPTYRMPPPYVPP